MSPVALILLMMALGWLLRRAPLPESLPLRLQWLVIYVLLPPLVWLSAQRIEWRGDVWLVILLPWLLGIIAALASWLIGRAMGWSRATIACLMLCSALGNTAFLGYPLVRALLGNDALPAAVIYDQLGTFLLLPTLGLWVTRVYAGAGEKRSFSTRAKELVIGIVRFPAVHALWIGLLPLTPPEILRTVASGLAALLVPVAMLSVGMQLKLVPARRLLAPAATGLAIKLGLAPLLAGMVMWAADAPPLLFETAILQAAMPPMVTAGALATSAKLDPDLAAALVGYGILLGVVWVPVLAWWV